MNGLQGGDPAKLAKGLIALASQDEPPRAPGAAGADAIRTFEKKATTCSPAAAHRELSTSLAHDNTNS